MSIKVTTWVWARSESRNGARLVMLALADRADDDGRAWPSIEDLCERTLLSPRAVQKGIAKLVEIGELKVESGGGRRVRNRYTIIPKPRTSDGATDEKPRQDDGVTDEEPRTSDGVSAEETPHFEPETPHFATETPSIVRENPVKSAGEPSLEPPQEPSENHHNYAAADGVDRAQLPEWVTDLQTAMSAAGINVPWKFVGDDLLRLHNDLQRLGIPLMVEQAVAAAQGARTQPFSSRWFYDRWHSIPTPAPNAAPRAQGGTVLAFPGQPRLSTTDQRVAAALAIAAELRAQEGVPSA